jgi:hypothetical protein
VGSYALPLGQANSYLPMHAAACRTPSDCWFGGMVSSPPAAPGAFHLHWDGQSLTAFFAPQDHAVASMAVLDSGTVLESVQLANSDAFNDAAANPSGNPAFEPLFHTLSPGAVTDYPNPQQYGTDAAGNPVDAETLSAFDLSSDSSSDYGLLPQSQHEAWAVAGPLSGVAASSSSAGVAHPIVLYFDDATATWTQVAGDPTAPGGGEPFPADVDPQQIADVPSAGQAWVTLLPTTTDRGSGAVGFNPDGRAHVAQLTLGPADPSTGEPTAATVTETDTLGPAQGVGDRGNAGPIACPEANDCWLATDQGWLFHYTDGSQLPVDTDPNFAGVITFRPTDAGVPQLPPDLPPADDSLANQQPAPPQQATKPPVQLVYPTTPLIKGKPKGRVVRGSTLELTFTLTAAAHVQLVAEHVTKTRSKHRTVTHTAIVAQTRRMTLGKGRHTISLKLDPRHWPNALNLKATRVVPLKPVPASSVKSTPPSGTPGAPSNSTSLST